MGKLHQGGFINIAPSHQSRVIEGHILDLMNEGALIIAITADDAPRLDARVSEIMQCSIDRRTKCH